MAFDVLISIEHVFGDNDDPASRLSRSKRGTNLRCNHQNRKEFVILLERKRVQFDGIAQQLLNLAGSRSIDVIQSVHLNFVSDDTNHSRSVLLIQATTRCFLGLDDDVSIAIVPNNTLQILELGDFAKSDSYYRKLGRRNDGALADDLRIHICHGINLPN